MVPAHVGVEGNHDLDKIAKQALVIDLDIPLGKSEMKGLIKTAIKICGRRGGIKEIKVVICTIYKNKLV